MFIFSGELVGHLTLLEVEGVKFDVSIHVYNVPFGIPSPTVYSAMLLYSTAMSNAYLVQLLLLLKLEIYFLTISLK